MDIELIRKLYQTFRNDPFVGIALVVLVCGGTILLWYFSSYIKEKAKIKATKSQLPKSDSDKKHDDHSQPKKEKGAHFQTINFLDGNEAKVQINITYKILDPIKYTYESTDPLGILSNLVDARFRQLYEQFTTNEARNKRRESEEILKSDLTEEFSKYGIELKAITIGSIQIE